MSGRILVAYASRGGSTAGVAEAIGQTLAAGGSEVDVRSMTEIDDVTAYQAVVAGSAIQAHGCRRRCSSCGGIERRSRRSPSPRSSFA